MTWPEKKKEVVTETGVRKVAPKHYEAARKGNVISYPIKSLAELKLVVISEGDALFETGKAVTFKYIRNNEKSPHGQDIEPSGRYMLHNVSNFVPPGWESGTVTFEKPIVLNWNGWKQRMSQFFDEKVGKKLSRTIAKDGYDGIVTVDGEHTEEIIDLTMF
ncbi:MAG: hypothetical protein WC623_22525 [Pedobacter sp.]|uniref:hypothetical protein n=1 Tax=Pedobacter sp. TaxID=1411316 RepID=UPI003566B544